MCRFLFVLPENLGETFLQMSNGDFFDIQKEMTVKWVSVTVMNIDYGGSVAGLLLHLPACHKPLSQRRPKSWVIFYWNLVNHCSAGRPCKTWGTSLKVRWSWFYWADRSLVRRMLRVTKLEQRMMVKKTIVKDCVGLENVKKKWSMRQFQNWVFR